MTAFSRVARDALRFNLVFRRAQVRLSQSALAERVGISRPLVSDIEQGRASVTLDVLERIATTLETDVAKLLTPVRRGASDADIARRRKDGPEKFVDGATSSPRSTKPKSRRRHEGPANVLEAGTQARRTGLTSTGVRGRIQGLSGKPGRFEPRLDELFDARESDPKQYPLKRRAPLAGCRAAPVYYNRTQVWRCVFEVDDVARIVIVLALDLHDVV